MHTQNDVIFLRCLADLIVLGCVGTALIYACLLLLGKVTFKEHLTATGLAFGSTCLAAACNVYKDGKINPD